MQTKRVSLFGEPHKQNQFQSNIFMIMPFDSELGMIYKGVIKPIVADLGLTIKRGDDFSGYHGSIMDEIWSALNICQLAIVECTIVNGNVYYELGIAHTIGVPTILITQNMESIPFDLRHLRFIHYSPDKKGRAKLDIELRKVLTQMLENISETSEQAKREDS
jgi:hypothetical protein